MVLQTVSYWFLILLTIIGHQLVSCSDQEIRDCGQHAHGSVVEQGSYYYMCNNGFLDPLGCVNGALERVPIGSTFRSREFLMRCSLGADGFLSIDYDACLVKDTVVAPGGTFENDKHWFSCSRLGDSFLIQLQRGCVAFDGRRLKINEEFVDGDTAFACRDTTGDGAPEIAAVGCAFDGRRLTFGESFSDERFAYSCQHREGRATKKAIGCVKDGRTLFDGQKYISADQSIFRCEILEGKSPRHVVVGCALLKPDANGETEKALGCRWFEGVLPYQYTAICEATNDGAIKRRVNCFFTSDNAEYILEPGCFRIVRGQGIGCSVNAISGLDCVSFEADRLDKAYEYKLQLC